MREKRKIREIQKKSFFHSPAYQFDPVPPPPSPNQTPPMTPYAVANDALFSH